MVIKVQDNSGGSVILGRNGFFSAYLERTTQKSIWVFEESFASLEIASVSWPGTIVAPSARLLSYACNIEGNAYVASFGGQDFKDYGEFHCKRPIVPDFGSCSVDQPVRPSFAPVFAPTRMPASCVFLTISAVSRSGSAGKASLDISDAGVDTRFDDAWLSRGFNVLVLSSESGEVQSTSSFDVYASTTQSTAMLNF